MLQYSNKKEVEAKKSNKSVIIVIMPKLRSIGLTEKQKQSVIELLNSDLAELYTLLSKTQKSYWSVVGPQFQILHQLWEEQYQTLTEKIEQTAQRIRALGGSPIATVEEFLKHSTIKDRPGNLPNDFEMSEIENCQRAA